MSGRAQTPIAIVRLLCCALIVAVMPCAPLLSASGVNSSVTVAAAQTGPADGAMAELVRGQALLRRGRASEALIQLENALKLFRQAGNKRGEAAAHDLLGELYERQGRYKVALEHFTDAHEIFTADAAAASQNNLVGANAVRQFSSYNANLMMAKIGNMHYRQGQAVEARAAYGRMNVTKPESNPLNVVRSVQSKVSRVRGFGARLRGMATGTPNTSTGTAAKGTADEAVDIVTQPAELYRQAIIYATHELGLGRVDYLNGELDDARKHFQNALVASLANIPVIGRLGQTRRYRTAARTSLADVAHREGRFAEAIKLYAEALKGAREDGRLDLMWPAERGTGRSLWAQAAQESDAARASKLSEDGLAAYREALRTIEAIRAGSLRADESRTTFLATTKDVFDEASSGLAGLALASSAVAAGAPLEGRSLEYAVEALRIVEQGRARSLLDLLSETGTGITEGIPTELLKRKQGNQEQQEAIAAQLTGVQFGSEAPAKSPLDLESELARLQTEFDSIENEIRAVSPRYAALTTTEPLALADIQQRVLDDGTALLEYSLGADQSYLWAVTRGGLNLYRLPARSVVEKQTSDVRDQIIPRQLRRSITSIAADPSRGIGLSGPATNDPPVKSATAASAAPSAAASFAGVTPSAFAAAAHALYKSVVEPARAVIGERRLLVVADGALNYVPFETLVTEAPAAGVDYSTLPYLLKKNEVVYAPSASVLAAVRQQSSAAAANRGRDLLLIADPVFDSSDPRARAAKPGAVATGETATGDGKMGDAVVGQAARGLALSSAVEDLAAQTATGDATTAAGAARIARLPGTRAEAQQIAQFARTAGRRAELWLDLDASESNIETRDLKKYRVLHVATHGLLDTERPQFTGLVLSQIGGSGGGDGFLRTDEIFNLRLGSPLVMLSACETGLGREKRGEGVIGLTRAFMYAGAPTVGVSLWSVSDRSTAELMTDFYRRLLVKDGTSPTAALRDARRQMIAGKKYSAPFYWSPFVLVGDWR